MQRRVEGTYLTPEEVMHAIERLLQEGYVGEEIVVITDDQSDYQSLEDLTLVEVDAVDPDAGKSLWEKTKETLSFGNYHSDEASSPLEEYGVDGEMSEQFTTALENGEIVLLVDSSAPAHLDSLSTVNEEVLNHSEKEEPAETPTKESFDVITGDEGYFDPSQAQSSREDKVSKGEIDTHKESNETDQLHGAIETNDGVKGDVPEHSASVQKNDAQSDQQSNQKDPVEEANQSDQKDVQSHEDASSLKETPELTGDEDTVKKEPTGHAYPDNINTGVVGGSDKNLPKKSPVEDGKPNEDATTDTAPPESDAYYSDTYKAAGGKSIEDDENK